MSEELKDWESKAKFMRESGAVHAEWVIGDMGGYPGERLSKLVLAPLPSVRPVSSEQPKQDGPKGVAARLMKQHEVQFAHTRFKPPLKLPGSAESDVPRAVSAKRDVTRGSSTKVQKRAS